MVPHASERLHGPGYISSDQNCPGPILDISTQDLNGGWIVLVSIGIYFKIVSLAPQHQLACPASTSEPYLTRKSGTPDPLLFQGLSILSWSAVIPWNP